APPGKLAVDGEIRLPGARPFEVVGGDVERRERRRSVEQRQGGGAGRGGPGELQVLAVGEHDRRSREAGAAHVVAGDLAGVAEGIADEDGRAGPEEEAEAA